MDVLHELLAADVFKNIRSKDRKKELEGVENSAWDLVFITAWFERIKAQAKTNELTRFVFAGQGAFEGRRAAKKVNPW